MSTERDRSFEHDLVGVIPAAGQATRIAPLPCSKELYPVGFQTEQSHQDEIRPKVVCQYLLEKMRLAGIRKAFIVLRQGKWDIPAYLEDGSSLNMHLSYLMMGLPFGVPFTIDQAYPFVNEATVALGFPDTLFGPDDAFSQLLDEQAASGSDVVLGIFPADRPHKVDMVDIADDGQIRQIVIKPRKTDLRYRWAIAVWTPVFTHFMHEYLANLQTHTGAPRELFPGEVIQAAIDNNLKVKGVHVSDEPLIDIGTSDDLLRAIRYLMRKVE